MQKRKLLFAVVLLVVLLSLAFPPVVSAKPREFTPYQELKGILEKIAETSNRVNLEVIGKSAGGHDIYLVTIANPWVIQRLQFYKWFAQLTVNNPTLARKLVDKGIIDYKATVYIHGSIHGNEMPGTDACLDIIRLLAFDNSKEVQNILDNAIIILNVCANPDGRIADTRENDNGFDLNRDFITASQPEDRAVIQRVFLEWAPLVTLDLHGFIENYTVLIEPCTPPHNPNNEFDLLIQHLYPMALSMEEALHGIGVDTLIPYRDWNATWDDYPPIFTPMYGFYHGSFGITFETTDPWAPGGSIDLSIESHFVGSMAAIEYTVTHKDEMFDNQAEIFMRGINRGNGRFPYAYIIPTDPELQMDPLEATDLVNHLIFHGVKVHEAPRSFTAGGTVYPRGTYVVLMNQSRSGLANTILWDGQNLSPPPDYGLKFPMYDISGWNFPELWGVTVTPVESKFWAPLTPVWHARYPKGDIEGRGWYGYALKGDTNNAVIMVNRLLDQGIQVYRTTEPFESQGVEFGVGTFIIPAKNSWTRWNVYKEAKSLHLTLFSINKVKVDMKLLHEPEVALLYDSGIDPESYGAAKFVLNSLDFHVNVLNYDDVREGALHAYDIVIVPDGWHEDIWNELGTNGQYELRNFIETGGTYLGYGEGGGALVNEAKFINATADLSEWYGGYNNGIVRIEYNPNDTVSAYYPEEGYSFVFFPVWFEAGEGVEASAKYAETNLLVAGWWPYYDVTAAGFDAVVRGEYGDGNVILMGMQPMFRAHPEFTFRLVANSIFFAAQA
jgi:glutamine amidotransferase-like uncharacterized protein